MRHQWLLGLLFAGFGLTTYARCVARVTVRGFLELAGLR